MTKDLTSSRIDRQNILDNELIVTEIQESLNIKGLIFEGRSYFTEKLVARFFDVDLSIVEKCIQKHIEELKENGYEVLQGERLESFISAVSNQSIPGIEGNCFVCGTSQVAIFDFHSLLNLSMLLKESARAQTLRLLILDIAIDLANQETGGKTWFINQSDKDFIDFYLQDEKHSLEFIKAIDNFVDMGNIKYVLYTDKIYQSLFAGKAEFYREYLKINRKQDLQDAVWSEALNIVLSYEDELANVLEAHTKQIDRKLNLWEVDRIFCSFADQAKWENEIQKNREKIGDLEQNPAIKDSDLEIEMHEDCYQELEQLMIENEAVLIRLKERG